MVIVLGYTIDLFPNLRLYPKLLHHVVGSGAHVLKCTLRPSLA